MRDKSNAPNRRRSIFNFEPLADLVRVLARLAARESALAGRVEGDLRLTSRIPDPAAD